MPKTNYSSGNGGSGGGGGGGLINGTGIVKNHGAPRNKDGGNVGKPIGDIGQMSKNGNKRTYQVSDRYK